ncbi:PAS domain-containing hybrid sensor histidine kinase/response regulator [Geodermatophilus sp. CPCC 205761]|uniref:PAS domain-containing hybrid sensor histidine kinase/response regulator n=1 Tax=Geodermatophilus sp. CPCC 205761 TaxID=2936597 RepID=UPI003EEDD65C
MLDSTDPSLVIVSANDALCALLGRPSDQLVGTSLSAITVGADDLRNLLVTNSVAHRLETWCVDGRGRHIPILLDGAALDDPSGTAIVQFHEPGHGDVERALRESEKRLQEIADNATALIYLKRTDGRYLFINRRYETMLGVTRDDAVGRTDFDLWPPEIAAAYTSADRAVVSARQPLELEEPIPTKDDRFGMWLSLKFPLFDEGGELYGVGGISTDISERNRAEAAIREARDEAERANRAKSEFLSRMSHELRTPLNSILGFGQLLQFEELPPSAAEGVDRILSAGRHLLALINEVLDISRIEAGAQAISVEPVHVCDPISEACELVRPLAAEHGVELARDLHNCLYRYVAADYQRLKQVLLNMLMNAVKYNRPDGMVTVSGEVHGDKLRVLVTDTGIGIEPEDVPKVFQPFERLHTDRLQAEGTGLGLALSKSLMEAMGGTIGLQRSVVDRGSIFYVELPLTDPPSAVEPVAPVSLAVGRSGPTSLAGRTVLCVEDNLANLEVIRGVFSHAGEPALLPAIQGQLGVELAKLHVPDVILLDLHLPDMNGEEVLRRLKGDPRTRAIPVVVLSADATPSQRERLLEQGAADYVTKPIEIDVFLPAVQRAMGKR